jgi:hypothetical protein
MGTSAQSLSTGRRWTSRQLPSEVVPEDATFSPSGVPLTSSSAAPSVTLMQAGAAASPSISSPACHMDYLIRHPYSARRGHRDTEVGRKEERDRGGGGGGRKTDRERARPRETGCVHCDITRDPKTLCIVQMM